MTGQVGAARGRNSLSHERSLHRCVADRDLPPRRLVAIGVIAQRFLLAAVFAVAALVWAPPAAHAAYLTGTVDYVGPFSRQTDSFLTSSQVSITSAVVFATTGDFAALMGFPDFLVHASPITYNPATFPVQPLWTHLGSGTYSDLLQFSVFSIGKSSLDLRGKGTFYATGFDPTPGSWIMTLSTFHVIGTFSATSRAVPEPGMLTLFGTGMLLAGRFSETAAGPG